MIARLPTPTLVCLLLMALLVPRPSPGIAPVPGMQMFSQFCPAAFCPPWRV